MLDYGIQFSYRWLFGREDYMTEFDRVPIDSIHIDSELKPQMDEHLLELMDAAMAGNLPVFFGAVPISHVVPFDLDYRPDKHPIGAQAIDAFLEDWKQGRYRHLLVYPRGIWFVVSDHYISLFAALRGRVEYLPCWILGKPENAQIKDLQGPIAEADIPKILGMG